MENSDTAVPLHWDYNVVTLRIDGHINWRQLQGKISQRHDSLVFIDNYICSWPHSESFISGIFWVLNLNAVIRFVNLWNKANQTKFYLGIVYTFNIDINSAAGKN